MCQLHLTLALLFRDEIPPLFKWKLLRDWNKPYRAGEAGGCSVIGSLLHSWLTFSSISLPWLAGCLLVYHQRLKLKVCLNIMKKKVHVKLGAVKCDLGKLNMSVESAIFLYFPTEHARDPRASSHSGNKLLCDVGQLTSLLYAYFVSSLCLISSLG